MIMMDRKDPMPLWANYERAIIGPPAKRHFDDGPILNAGFEVRSKAVALLLLNVC